MTPEFSIPPMVLRLREPAPLLRAYLTHRRMREAQIRSCIARGHRHAGRDCGAALCRARRREPACKAAIADGARASGADGGGRARQACRTGAIAWADYSLIFRRLLNRLSAAPDYGRNPCRRFRSGRGCPGARPPGRRVRSGSRCRRPGRTQKEEPRWLRCGHGFFVIAGNAPAHALDRLEVAPEPFCRWVSQQQGAGAGSARSR